MKNITLVLSAVAWLLTSCGGGSGEPGSTSGALNMEYVKKLTGYAVPGYTFSIEREEVKGEDFTLGGTYKKDGDAEGMENVSFSLMDRSEKRMIHNLDEFKKDEKESDTQKVYEYEEMEVGGHKVYLRLKYRKELNETENSVSTMVLLNENGYVIMLHYVARAKGAVIEPAKENARAIAKLFVESMPKP